MKSIVLGGGCFWCTEAIFQGIKGVASVVSGYAGGGTDKTPDYWSIHSGNDNHAEVVRVEYDETVITLPQLLTIFFATHDPTTRNRQGYDKGSEYRSIILCSKDELSIVEQARDTAQQYWNDPIVTEIALLDAFYEAEEHHQNYYNTNQNNGYCQAIINPKLEKLQKQFKDFIV